MLVNICVNTDTHTNTHMHTGFPGAKTGVF